MTNNKAIIKGWIKQNKKSSLKRKEVDLKKEIKDFWAGLPNGQYKTGYLINKIGYKYVTVISLWEGGSTEKIELQTFFNENIA